MSKTLRVRNRQRDQPLDTRLLRQIFKTSLVDLLRVPSFELGLIVVNAREMTRLNETFLRHRGSTDVLAFDYRESSRETLLHGEVFVCLEEARLQAVRFRTSWQSELVRYGVHGLLHLLGHDDHQSGSRRRMKREENRLLQELEGRFAFSRLRKKGDARRGRKMEAGR